MAKGLFAGVRKKVLDNGLTVLINEDRAAGVVALEVFVKIGSNNETDDIWGWSHGIEHMLFKGTARRGVGDVAREVTELGGTMNAGTWYESTTYYITCPREGFTRALDIHADVLEHSAFREEDLDRERRVLVEELNMYRDVPDGVGFTLDELMNVAFTRHRYRRAVIGIAESLEKTSREAIVDYYRRGYVPANMVYVVVGDVDADDALAAIESTLGTIPARPPRLPAPDPEPEQTTFRHVALTGDIEEAYFKIAFHIPGERHEDTPALRVLTHLLGSGRSSRFHRNLVEEAGLVSHIGLMDVSSADPGVLIVDATAEPKDVEEAIAAVYVEARRFHDELVTEADLEKALNNVIAAFVSTLESVQGQASMLGHFELLGDHALADAYAAEIARVSAEDVRRVAARYLRFDASTVLTYLPGAPTEPDRSGEAALAERLRARIAEHPRATVASSGTAAGARRIELPSIAPSFEGKEGEIEERALPGGAPLLVRRRPKLPTVALAVYGRAGLRFERSDRLGAGTLATRCLLKGTRARSDEALAEEIERHAISIRPFSDRDTTGLYVECLTGQLPRALDLFAEILSEPAFDHDAIERERALLLADIRQEHDDTSAVTFEAFRSRVFGDHPYGWNPLGTETSAQAVTREDLVDWHRRFFVLGNLAFAAVGDIDADWLARELTARLDLVPEGPVPTPPPLVLATPTSLERCVLTRDKEQAVIVFGVPAPSMHSDMRFPLYVLDHMLSDMAGRLFTELRNTRNLCYHTQSFFSPLEDAGVFGAFVGTTPERVDEAIEALHGELERTRLEPPSAAELERSIAAITGKRLISMQRNGRQAAAMARRQALGPGYREVFAFPERIRAVTSAEILHAARTTLTLEQAVLAVLTPKGDEAQLGRKGT